MRQVCVCVCVSYLSRGQLSPSAVSEASVMLLQPDTQRFCNLWHPRHRLTKPSSVICWREQSIFLKAGRAEPLDVHYYQSLPPCIEQPNVCLTVQDCIFMVVSSGQCFCRCFNAPSSSWVQEEKKIVLSIMTSKACQLSILTWLRTILTILS